MLEFGQTVSSQNSKLVLGTCSVYKLPSAICEPIISQSPQGIQRKAFQLKSTHHVFDPRLNM